MLRRLFSKNWKESDAHLLLLSKFRSPRMRDDYAGDERCQEVLKEKPEKAIKRFLKEGMIERADLPAALAYKFKVSELKPMLRERDLKVSGRKAQLIESLVEADRRAMEKAVRGLEVLQCTAEGREVAERYLAREKAAREEAEENVLRALKSRNFKRAGALVAEFEAEQVFSRGIGIDWANHSTTRDEKVLKTIFQSRPRILARLTDEELDRLRLAGAMAYLWGTNRPGQWLPDGFETKLSMKTDAAARMFWFHATHRINLSQYRDAGFKTVRILAAGDSCEACQKIADKEYPIGEVPELPYEHCTHKMGCRCQTVVGTGTR